MTQSTTSFTQIIRKLTKKSAFVQEKVRAKSLHDINLFLQNYDNVAQLSLIHCRMLWRGLLHGFHLCDGFEKQLELAGDLARLFWHIVTPAEILNENDDDVVMEPEEKQKERGEKFVLWMNAFYAELTRMWKYLDKWMLSKFMSLVRFTFHETLKYLYLSYDLTFEFSEVKDSEATQTSIHASGMVEALPDEDNSEKMKTLVPPKKKKAKKAANGTAPVQCSIIDFYNIMMGQNLLVSDGLHTSDISLFHVEIIVEEFVKMISELVRETNPDVVVEGLDDEQRTVFFNILQPYMNTYLTSVSQPYITKFQKSILELLLQDTDAKLIEQVFRMLGSQKVKAARTQEVLKWKTQYKLRLSDLRAVQSANPLESLQAEMDEFSKEVETKQEKSQKKKRKKANKKKKKQAPVVEEITTADSVEEDAMQDVEEQTPAAEPEVPVQNTTEQPATEKKKRKRRKKKSAQKNAEAPTTTAEVQQAQTVTTTTTTLSTTTTTTTSTKREKKREKKSKAAKASAPAQEESAVKPAEPLVVTLDKNQRVQITTAGAKKAKKDTSAPVKKRVIFHLENNQTKVYKINSKVKNVPIDSNATPEKSILKAPAKPGKSSSKDSKNNSKKRKRSKSAAPVEDIPSSRVNKRMRRMLDR